MSANTSNTNTDSTSIPSISTLDLDTYIRTVLESDLESDKNTSHEDYPYINLSNEVNELYLTEEIEIIYNIPTSLEFYKYVAKNIPIIIKNGISNWNAIKLWNHKYIEQKLNNVKVSVNSTPNGLADAIISNYFVRPEKRSLYISEFFKSLESPEEELNTILPIKELKDLNVNNSEDYSNKLTTNTIYYISEQNSSLTTEFEPLMKDIEFLKWANEAFDAEPDATNIWIGEDRSVSTLHHDPYENLYCVVKGTKHFVLYPPTDAYFLARSDYPNASYKYTPEGWIITPDDGTTKWIDLEHSDKKRVPITCEVEAGDILYLPSLWYHQVYQRKGTDESTIAVNFWYDMQYDIKYVYHNFMMRMIEKQKEKEN